MSQKRPTKSHRAGLFRHKPTHCKRWWRGKTDSHISPTDREPNTTITRLKAFTATSHKPNMVFISTIQIWREIRCLRQDMSRPYRPEIGDILHLCPRKYIKIPSIKLIGQWKSAFGPGVLESANHCHFFSPWYFYIVGKWPASAKCNYSWKRPTILESWWAGVISAPVVSHSGNKVREWHVFHITRARLRVQCFRAPFRMFRLRF